MGRHAPAPRVMVRGLMACLVLAGIFVMHGLPASSCGAPQNGSTPSMTGAGMASHPALAMPGPAAWSGDAAPAAGQLIAPTSVAIAASPDAPAGTGAVMAGGVCVSTPPWPTFDLAGLLALALLAAVAGGDRPAPHGAAGRFARRRRGPPRAGPGQLLIRLCISRT